MEIIYDENTHEFLEYDYSDEMVTIDEMREMLKDEDFDDLQIDSNTGLYCTNYFIAKANMSLLKTHYLVERMQDKLDHLDWPKLTCFFDDNIIDTILKTYFHPLIWIDHEESYRWNDKIVTTGKVAMETTETTRTYSAFTTFITCRLPEICMLWFADTLPSEDEGLISKYPYSAPYGMIVWKYLVSDLYEKQPFNENSFLINIRFIAEERGGARAAEIVRKLREDWSDIVTMKLFNIDKLTPEQIENFRAILFEGMNRYISKWEAESIPAQNENAKPAHFPLITEKCKKNGKIDSVEAGIRAACHGTAVGLWKILRTNAALDYIEPLEPWKASDLYRAISDYFGDLPYNERNFRDARSKR